MSEHREVTPPRAPMLMIDGEALSHLIAVCRQVINDLDLLAKHPTGFSSTLQADALRLDAAINQLGVR